MRDRAHQIADRAAARQERGPEQTRQEKMRAAEQPRRVGRDAVRDDAALSSLQSRAHHRDR